MSLDKDIDSVKRQILEAAHLVLTSGESYNVVYQAHVAKARMMIACARLPGDMPLRVWCQPNIFKLEA